MLSQTSFHVISIYVFASVKGESCSQFDMENTLMYGRISKHFG